MFIFFLKRFAFSIVTLVLILVTCFALFYLFPEQISDEDGNRIKTVTSKFLFSEFGFIENYEIFKHRAYASWPLAFFSLITVIFFSMLLSFLFQKFSFLSKIIKMLKFLLLSIPVIILGPMLIWLFCIKLNWFELQISLNSPISLILPVFLLSYKSIGVCTDILINAYQNYYKSDHYRTLLSFGVSENLILLKWGLKFSIPALFSYIPFLLAGLFTGSVFVEFIFSNSGLGSLFIESISKREVGMLLTLCAFYFLVYTLAKFLADILLYALNPRLSDER